jgi:Holliday junction DNA helicase RuvA
MIAMLRGRVAAATLGQVVLDVGGVGYAVRVAPGASVGQAGVELTLHTSLAVREDSLTLYGFPSASARDLFEVLLGVSGVGPKVALAALGTLGEDGLRRAVVAEDVTALTVVPGVGRKGAQRMILELRERLGPGTAAELTAGAAPAAGSARGEAAQALVALGYAPAEAARALDDLAAPDDAAAEELLRGALRAIGSRA